MRKHKYHAGQVLMTDVGNLFTIKAVIVNKELYGQKGYHYQLIGHKGFNSLPVDYIDSSKHIKPATRAGRLLFERARITNGTN